MRDDGGVRICWGGGWNLNWLNCSIVAAEAVIWSGS